MSVFYIQIYWQLIQRQKHKNLTSTARTLMPITWTVRMIVRINTWRRSLCIWSTLLWRWRMRGWILIGPLVKIWTFRRWLRFWCMWTQNHMVWVRSRVEWCNFGQWKFTAGRYHAPNVSQPLWNTISISVMKTTMQVTLNVAISW